MIEDQQINLDEALRTRMKELPTVVQKAIMSSDVQQSLRTLADSHKLHLDQWQTLENQVMLALLGFLPVEDLANTLKEKLKTSADVANELAADISRIVFEPVREALEREMEQQNSGNPVAGPVPPTVPPTPAVVPATPPAPASEGKAIRAPITENYKPAESSTARTAVDEDPYREKPV